MTNQCIFVEDIPDDAMRIKFYVDKQNNEHIFEEMRYLYFFDEETNQDIFYSEIDEYTYRILHINENLKGEKFVFFSDCNNQIVYLYINRFKYQHTIIT